MHCTPDTADIQVDEVSSESTIHIPKICDVIRCLDPDTNQPAKFIVLSRAGKATSSHKYWLNVKTHTRRDEIFEFPKGSTLGKICILFI